jgi:ribosomal protein S18 acetylase RimI-like enzyme
MKGRGVYTPFIIVPMSASFTVRAARSEDRDAILTLIPRLFDFGPEPLRPLDLMIEAESNAIRRFFDESHKNAGVWVAEFADGSLAGMVYAQQETDYFTGEAHAHLDILTVAKAAEGHGVGRALIETVEEWSRRQGYRFVDLNVFKSNVRATAVYERLGYRPDTMRYVKELGSPPSA